MIIRISEVSIFIFLVFFAVIKLVIMGNCFDVEEFEDTATIEDLVPEAFQPARRATTKVSPEGETEIDLDSEGDTDEEEEDTQTCRQQ